VQQIAVVGAGYVGLVTGACLAELGNVVTCIDNDPVKFASLREGEVPFFEPGLQELVARNQAAGRLGFRADVADGIKGRQIVFIAVGTPTGPDGQLDLRAIREAAQVIAESLDGPKIVVNKSTVPVQTADLVAGIISERNRGDHPVSVVSNPEFLREGSAVADFMKPDRIVIGVGDAHAEAALRELYAPLHAPIVVTDARTAEMIKLTANAFLAVKISFINEIANICEHNGADVNDVIAGAGSDARIGMQYMNPGLGFGGSCIPKDLRALVQIAEKSQVPARVLRAALEVNRERVDRAVQRLSELLDGLNGKRLAQLGLSFKPETDDIRESPAIALAKQLASEGAQLTVHDPVATEKAARVLGDSVRYAGSPYDAAADADAVIVATEWREYTQLDFTRLRAQMAGVVLFDLRNVYDPETVASHDLMYAGVRSTGAVNEPERASSQTARGHETTETITPSA